MIKPAPIREAATDKAGLFTTIWTLWFQNLVIRLNSGNGVTSTFTTVDGKTVTVTDGIITEIV